jgi:hypothetical protein
MDSVDEFQRVTASMLRYAESMCPRRLRHELESGKKLAGYNDARFRLSNRVTEDARLAHASLETPVESAFVQPSDLEHEEQSLYRAAIIGYLRVFGGRAVIAEDIGRSSDVAALKVRLSGTPGLAVRNDDGRAELRVLRIGHTRSLTDEFDRRFTVLRVADWEPNELRMVVVDLLDGEPYVEDVDIAAELPGATAWLTEKVDAMNARAHPRQTRVGSDCRMCACIPGCPALTRDP